MAQTVGSMSAVVNINCTEFSFNKLAYRLSVKSLIKFLPRSGTKKRLIGSRIVSGVKIFFNERLNLRGNKNFIRFFVVSLVLNG